MALRFAISPVWETVAALRLLAAPARAVVHRRWLGWARERLRAVGKDRSLLHVMIRMPVVPEFLILTPGVRFAGIDEEIAGLSRMTPQRIAAAVGDDPRMRPLLADPGPAVVALQERLRAVHDAIIAPVWPRIEGVLQGDVERRGRVLIDAGGPALLTTLHPAVEFTDPDLVVAGKPVIIGKRDLVLMPSAFVWPDVYLRDAPKRLALCYPAHGFGSLWERTTAPTSSALARLVGATRARLLAELDRPCTVSELASRLGVTVAAVSQHLGVLRAAGLAVSRREGREVVSLRTALGLALVQGELP